MTQIKGVTNTGDNSARRRAIQRLNTQDDTTLPVEHATTHQNGGSDEINVAGLSGLLADPQTPLAHKTTHENGGSDEISVAGLSGLLADPQTPLAHKTTHQNGGSDEIDVTGLSGLLADPQTPLAHASTHYISGSDELDADFLGVDDTNWSGAPTEMFTALTDVDIQQCFETVNDMFKTAHTWAADQTFSTTYGVNFRGGSTYRISSPAVNRTDIDSPLYINLNAARVGINLATPTPTVALDIEAAGTIAQIRLAQTSVGGQTYAFQNNSQSVQPFTGFRDETAGDWLMGWNNSQQVTIGDSTLGTDNLTLYNSGTSVVFAVQNGSTDIGAGNGFTISLSTLDVSLWNYESSDVLFGTDNSEVFRLDSGTSALFTSTNSLAFNTTAEAISSKNAGYLDVDTTTACRFNTGDVWFNGDSLKSVWGAGQDMEMYYDGTDGYLSTNVVTASDLYLACGTDKTLELTETVWQDIQFTVSSGRVPASNAPNFTTFTTNTKEYSFDPGEYIYLDAEEMDHWWKEGTSVSIHIHVTTDGANATGANRYAKFTVYFAYAGAGDVWTETSVTAELTIPDGTADMEAFILGMGTVALTGKTIGLQTKARVDRITATGGTEFADGMFITQVGLHAEKNTLGSRQLFVK
jgi:hypothetical protein